MTTILGLDPGKTTGWAIIRVGEDRKVELGLIGETKDMALLEIEPRFDEADVIVYENFLVRPKNAMKGDFNYDPMFAPQVIGAIKTLAALKKKDLQKQEPAIKPVGYGFAGLQYTRGKKGMHVQDAIAHAWFYAVKQLHALPRVS